MLMSKYIYIHLVNPLKTYKKIKDKFISLKWFFKCGKFRYPPVTWCSKPALIQIISSDVGWKDKYDTPRYEWNPYIWIHLFGFNMIWYLDFPYNNYRVDQYWEQALWYLYYYNNISYGSDTPDIEKAKKSWPWEDYKTGKSTWEYKYLKNENFSHIY